MADVMLMKAEALIRIGGFGHWGEATGMLK